MLVHHARIIYDMRSLEEEIQYSKRTFKKNGYSNQDVSHLYAKNKQ
jgi:hypothetical protein